MKKLIVLILFFAALSVRAQKKPILMHLNKYDTIQVKFWFDDHRKTEIGYQLFERVKHNRSGKIRHERRTIYLNANKERVSRKLSDQISAQPLKPID